MAGKRKTKDVYVIETNYGYGWEEEDICDTFAEMATRYREYMENVVAWDKGQVRWKKKRIKNIEPSKSLLAPVYGAEYVRQLNEKKGEE